MSGSDPFEECAEDHLSAEMCFGDFPRPLTMGLVIDADSLYRVHRSLDRGEREQTFADRQPR